VRLTIRVRLTLLYTALFVVCGGVVVVITYGLVASNIGNRPTKQASPVEFINACKLAQSDPSANPELRVKCEAAYQEGLDTGAKTQRDALLSSLLSYSIGTLAAVALLSALAGWFAAGRALRPLHRITAAAREASEHNLGDRVALTGPRDELRELADTFDAMLERLQRAFEGQRRFIANAGHELRTPLTVVRTTVDVVLAKPEPTTAELLGMGRDVRAATCRAEALIEALLTLARNQAGLTVREPVDLATVTEDALDELDPGPLTVRRMLEPAPAQGDPVLLERLVANLLDNAVRHNVDGGEIRVLTSTVDGRVTVQVASTGPVVPPDAVDGLFEPFRRLNDRIGGGAGGGFGLGLAIVAAIAAVHDGAVHAEPVDGGGLRVTFTMPRAPAATDPAP
jgi:signal transduction histidine kinase